MAQSTSQPIQPAIVIVPGSFSPPSLYTALSEYLQKDGYETIIGTLESASREPPAPGATMQDDAAAFHAIIEKLADQGKDVVVVAHSYGGIVATQAAEGLAKTDREAGGKKGGIVRVVYLSALVPEAGQSLRGVRGDSSADHISVKGDYMVLDAELGGKVIFSDLPLEEGIKWASKLTLQSVVSFSGPLTYPAYKHIPVAYIVCERDQVIPPETQRCYIARVEEEIGKPVPTVSLDAGHCPNASIPGEVAQAIKQAIAKE